MNHYRVCASVSLVSLLGACGGSSSNPGGAGALVPQPTRAISVVNTANLSGGSAYLTSLSSRTGTATLSGLVGSDIESLAPGQGSRSIVGETNLNVNFDTGQVSGRATNFWEVVGGTDGSGQMQITQWVQGLRRTLNQTGTLSERVAGTGIVLDTSGNLRGTMDVNGTAVSGTYSVVADDNLLLFFEKGCGFTPLGTA